MTATIPFDGDLERPCTICGAEIGQPCITRAWAGHPSRPYEGVHVNRCKDFNTAPMSVIRGAGRWTGQERRTWNEEDHRTDERGVMVLRLTARLGTLGEGDERRVGLLAAIEIIGGAR